MKTKAIISAIIFLCITGIVNAQIKVFDGGNVSVGSTIAPATGCKQQLVGNSVYTANTGSITSAAFIRGLNGYSTASSPDYTWYNNLNTGIFHQAINTICFTTNGSEVMRLVPSGNVLIGNNGDWAEKLSVTARNQPALITYVHHEADWMYAQASYVNYPTSKGLSVLYDDKEKFKVYGNGDVYAHEYYHLGDLKMTENITPITDALKKVMMLNGVSFNYQPDVLNDPEDTITFISTDPPKTLIGLIAEDVEPIVPEVIKTFEDGLKGISYGNLVALLIEAIKEQEIQINALEETLAIYCSNPNSNQENMGDENLKQVGQDNQDRSFNHQPDLDKPVLYQNMPNPFSEKTKIQYYLPENIVEAAIMIFDMQGTLLKTYNLMNKGNSSLEIFGSELKPGMYMYSLITDRKEIDTKKMILTN
jgi:hypothetical protein